MGKNGQAHDLHLVIRGGSLKANDGGPFANKIYNPECELSAIDQSKREY